MSGMEPVVATNPTGASAPPITGDPAPASRSVDTVKQPSVAMRPTVVPAIPNPVETSGAIKDSSPASFMSIFGGKAEGLDFKKGVTFEELQKAGSTIKPALFELIAHNMKIDEADGRKTEENPTITEDDITEFFKNADQFREMAQLPAGDIGNVAQLYNNEGVKFTRVDASQIKQMSDAVKQKWGALSTTEKDPYKRLLKSLSAKSDISDEEVKTFTSGVNTLSKKIIGKDFGPASDDERMKMIDAYIFMQWAMQEKIDVEKLYGVEGAEGASSGKRADGTLEPESATKADQSGKPVIDIMGEPVTDKDLGAVIKNNIGKEMKSPGGMGLDNQGKAKALFQSVLMQKMLVATSNKVSNKYVTDDEARAAIKKEGAVDNPQNVKIAKSRLMQEKAVSNPDMEKELEDMMKKGVESIKVSDVQAIVKVINDSVGTGSNITEQDINAWISDLSVQLNKSMEGLNNTTRGAMPLTGKAGPQAANSEDLSAPAKDLRGFILDAVDGSVIETDAEKVKAAMLANLKSLKDKMSAIDDKDFSSLNKWLGTYLSGNMGKVSNIGFLSGVKNKTEAVQKLESEIAKIESPEQKTAEKGPEEKKQ